VRSLLGAENERRAMGPDLRAVFACGERCFEKGFRGQLNRKAQ